jgi:urease accessory protein
VIGVAGAVELRFECRASRTVLAASRVEAPMKVVRPFESADRRLVVQLITLGPGLCAGDTLRVDVTAGPGARVVVTTPAATKIMAMAGGERAAQDVRLVALEGSSLEYYPAVAIPFPGSTFVQTVSVEAAAGARAGVVEAWALGRQARGEYLEFARLSSRTSLAVDGRLAYSDATEMVPAVHDAANAAILAGRQYAVSGFWYGAAIDDGHTVAEPSDDGTLMSLASSRPGLVYLRALARDGPALDRVIRHSLDRVADAWRVAPVRLERFRC